MQVVTEELKYQQSVLKHLGYYKGAVDGIWSGDSIAAKTKFEFNRDFAPAIPNNGLPFGTSDRLPKGMHFKRDGNYIALWHKEITDEAMAIFMGKVEPTVAVRNPVISNDGPVIAEPATPAVEQEVVPEQTIQQESQSVEVKPQNNNQQQHRPQQKPHQQPNGSHRR